ncbi:MAG TPA: nitroreductase family protein [Nitrososphaeraceae archaeon]|nr:nitroreductase family protein [Nitrososphaeraceae archaeon]
MKKHNRVDAGINKNDNILIRFDNPLKFMTQEFESIKKRNLRYNINPIFVNRWSPRSMTGEEISHDDLMGLFEAARWAPSSYNNQPWRFIYAKRNTENWDRIYSLMVGGNKNWAKNASVLVVVVSRKDFEYNEKPARTYQFDAGSAWENLALEATSRGLATHAMQGFDYDKAKVDLEVPENFDVMAMIAIGKRGQKESLPSNLQKNEYPTDRKPLEEIVMEGRFKTKK